MRRLELHQTPLIGAIHLFALTYSLGDAAQVQGNKTQNRLGYLEPMVRTFGFLGALFSGLAVLAGAFGTHALRQSKSTRDMEIWSTASTYQLFHGLALLVLVAVAGKLASEKLTRMSAWLFTFGIVIFSGSLYAIVLSGQTKLGMVAPVGGLSLMVGWGVFAWNCRGALNKQLEE